MSLTTVIITIPWFYPAYKAGGPVQSVANMLHGSDGNIVFKVLTSDRDLGGSAINVEQDRWIAFGRRSSVFYSGGKIMRQLSAEKADILFINGIYSWRFNLEPILFATARRKIVSVRGMLHPGALSQKRLKKKLYLAAWRWLGLHRKVEFHASTTDEKKCIEAVFGPLVTVHIAANFPRTFPRQTVKGKKRGELNLVSVALLSPMKNIHLVLESLKHVTATVAYHIFGPVKDEGYWRQCTKLTAVLPRNITVHYHGDVHPQEVEGALENGHVFILPSKSENFGHALYEALSAGKPVITSHHTPWNGLKEKMAGLNVCPENGEELAAAIGFFAGMDGHELEVWSRGAATYAAAAIDIDAIKEQYRRMFGAAGREKEALPEGNTKTINNDAA